MLSGAVMPGLPGPANMTTNTDCPALPKGWKREEVIRRTGLSAGKVDVYYYRGANAGEVATSSPAFAPQNWEEVREASTLLLTYTLRGYSSRRDKKRRASFLGVQSPACVHCLRSCFDRVCTLDAHKTLKCYRRWDH
ncbi:unnamed protein product [Ixodes persulcatus]